MYNFKTMAQRHQNTLININRNCFNCIEGLIKNIEKQTPSSFTAMMVQYRKCEEIEVMCKDCEISIGMLNEQNTNVTALNGRLNTLRGEILQLKLQLEPNDLEYKISYMCYL